MQPPESTFFIRDSITMKLATNHSHTSSTAPNEPCRFGSPN